ncbi:MAG: alkaline phosphatase D family protein [Pseudomonadota bacterium]
MAQRPGVQLAAFGWVCMTSATPVKLLQNVYGDAPVILLLILLVLLSSPLAAAESVSRIAFGSCVDQSKPQPVWQGVLAGKPDLLVLLGDNVYADTASRVQLQAAYDQLAANPGFSRVRKAMPIEAIWDDHDYGENDGGADFPGREVSQQVFLDFFHEPQDSVRRATEGIYVARELGPPDQRIQLILLDTRSFKSPWTRSLNPLKRYRPDADPALTMLGEAQWAWLESELRKPAKLRLIASGIQVINDEHGYETWGHFPAERQRLFDLIRRTRANGVLLFSGDRHFAEIAELDAGIGYPLLEMTASGMTHSWEDGPSAPHSHQLAAYGGINFGLLTVDWTASDPLVSLGIHDVTGQQMTSVVRRLSQLAVPDQASEILLESSFQQIFVRRDAAG